MVTRRPTAHRSPVPRPRSCTATGRARRRSADLREHRRASRNRRWLADTTGMQLTLGVRRTRSRRGVTDNAVGGSDFRFKIWKTGTAEPSAWLVQANGDLSRGSIVLAAHRADVNFGNVTVAPDSLRPRHHDAAMSARIRWAPSSRVCASVPCRTTPRTTRAARLATGKNVRMSGPFPTEVKERHQRGGDAVGGHRLDDRTGGVAMFDDEDGSERQRRPGRVDRPGRAAGAGGPRRVSTRPRACGIRRAPTSGEAPSVSGGPVSLRCRLRSRALRGHLP